MSELALRFLPILVALAVSSCRPANGKCVDARQYTYEVVDVIGEGELYLELLETLGDERTVLIEVYADSPEIFVALGDEWILNEDAAFFLHLDGPR